MSGGGGLFDAGAGIDVENGLEGIVVAQYTFVRELLEDYLGGGGDVDAQHANFPRHQCAEGGFVHELFGIK